MINLIVRKERVGPIRGRHPWVFSGALKSIPEGLQGGEPVELTDDAGNFLAGGYFNSYSQIAVRLWSFESGEVVNELFFERRIKQAYEMRQKLVESFATPATPVALGDHPSSGRRGQRAITNAYRLVHAENDLLPGLIVDKYADYLSVQFHTPGIERWKKEIVVALVKIVKPKGVYERSDVGRRHGHKDKIVIPSEPRGDEPACVGRESLAQLDERTGILRSAQDDKKGKGLLYGDVPEKVKIKENDYQFYVDIIGGQKTGFFLDQRDKRQALTKYVKDKKVLNCFSYTGGFSVYALKAGASHVVSVDASQPALEMAEENVKLNKLDESKAEFLVADVKEYLADLASATPPSTLLERGGGLMSPPARGGARGGGGSESFDVIILDPPAFVKDRHKIREGLQGYRKINEMALRALPPGGILVTCSCSAHVQLEDFRFMLSEAAARAGRTVQILETYTHGVDHPELVAFTEGEYLKCLFALVK